jgi:hypothetical protein
MSFPQQLSEAAERFRDDPMLSPKFHWGTHRPENVVRLLNFFFNEEGGPVERMKRVLTSAGEDRKDAWQGIRAAIERYEWHRKQASDACKFYPDFESVFQNQLREFEHRLAILEALIPYDPPVD